VFCIKCFELIMEVLRETEGKYFDDQDSPVNKRVSLLNVF
jgi:hypothetical protein